MNTQSLVGKPPPWSLNTNPQKSPPAVR